MNELQGQEAYVLHEQVVVARNSLAVNMVELGRLLYEVREKKTYEALDYQTFNSYLAMPELGFSQRQAYYLISIYEKMALQMGIPAETIAQIGEAKSIIIKDHISEENKEEIINEAICLSRADLIAKYGKPKAHTEQDEGEVGRLSDYLCDQFTRYKDIPAIIDDSLNLSRKILSYVNRNGRKNS